jgi:hypothetical protein
LFSKQNVTNKEKHRLHLGDRQMLQRNTILVILKNSQTEFSRTKSHPPLKVPLITLKKPLSLSLSLPLSCWLFLLFLSFFFTANACWCYVTLLGHKTKTKWPPALPTGYNVVLTKILDTRQSRTAISDY